MSAQIEMIMWVILATVSAITVIALIQQHGFTRPQPRARAQAPKAISNDAVIATTEDLVEVTVEFGQATPGSGMLLLAAWRELHSDEEKKKYNLVFSVRGKRSRTYYFAEA